MHKEDYMKLLEKYKKEYTPKLLSIRNRLKEKPYDLSNEQFISLSNEYKNLIYKLINAIVLDLKKYYKVDPIVLTNGSLARSTNTIFSDIDINYLTTEDRKEIISFEDKVNYLLQEVLMFKGKDKIHSMVVYLPLISNNHYDFIVKNQYPIAFQDGIIYSKCRKNAEKLMFESYNSTRNIEDVVNYFNEHDNEKELNEWAYCYDLVTNSNQEVVFTNKRKCYRSNNNINQHIDNALQKINKDNNYLDDNSNYLRNCDIKKTYKSSVLFNIYNILAIVYRINKKIKKFDLNDFIKNDDLLDKEYYKMIIEYLKLIQILQMILDNDKIDLSSHSCDYLNLERINKYYKKITGLDNIITTFNEKKENIYQASNINLTRIRRMNNEK